MIFLRMIGQAVLGAAAGAVIIGGLGGFAVTLGLSLLVRIFGLDDLTRTSVAIIYIAAGIIGALLGVWAGVKDAWRVHKMHQDDPGSSPPSPHQRLR